MAAASARYSRVSQARAGVGMTPTGTATAPAAQKPAVSAACTMSPEMRVSRPSRMRGLCGHSACPLLAVSTIAAARPMSKHIWAVSSVPATPRTPSVPNNLAIKTVLSSLSGYL